jgi:hypothetical protein
MSPLTRAKVCCRLLVLVSFLVLLLGLEGQCRAQTLPVSFVARIDTPLPGSPLRPPPGCIAAADFNSDSKLDIVSCGNANNIWVLQGNGDGTFQPAVTYTVGTNYPEAVVLADFNGDGKTDILVVNNDSTVSVLLNNGDGTFQTQVVTNITTNAPGVVASGDFNGDGKADIAVPVVVPQHGDSAVAILLGNGDGTFQSPIQSTGYAVTPSSIQVADFNGDGELDVSWEAIESVAVFLGNGNGTVQPPLNTDTKVEGFYLTVADFNNDGIPDLAISSYESIDVFLGKGDGTFGTELSAPVGLPYRALLVGDFNGDGIPDLACYSGGVEEISILLGKGDGTFQQPLTYNIPGDTIAAGDFNGDGRLDVAAPGIYGENGPLEVMSVALGKGDGSFQLDTIIGTGGHGSGVANGSLLIADLNGDGKPDLINDGGDYVAIFLGNGNGTFQKQIAFGLEGGGNQVTQSNAAAGDFNHDGKLDLAVVDTGYIGVFLGNGDGTLQPEVQYGNGNTDYVAVGDFNRDGNPDIVSADSTGTVSVLLGNGDGTFGFPESFPGVGSFIVVADFNHDGKLDVAGTGALILGNGDGTFGSPINYPAGGGGAYIAIGDFNHDGNLDLVGSISSSQIDVMLGKGDGTFSTPSNFTVGNMPSSVAVSDFNGDGKLDIAVFNLGWSDVSVLLGNADGTFQPATYFATYGGFNSIAVADLNGDGSPDIAVRGMYLLFNRPQGSDASLTPYTLGWGDQDVGTQSAPQQFTLFNLGQTALTIDNINFIGLQASDFSQTNTCGTSVAAGADCAISATFKPTAAGIRRASLSVTDSGIGSPQTAPVYGTGIAPAVTLTPSSLTFPDQDVGTSSKPQIVNLNNGGTAPLIIWKISAAGDFSQTDNCGGSLPVSGSCQISVTFTPTVDGNRSGTLSVADDAAGSPQTAGLSGAGASLGLGIASGGSNSATVSAGQTASYKLTIGGAGVSGTATFRCTGAPKGATCALPASVSISASNASPVSVTVTTTSRTVGALSPSGLRPSPSLWAMAALGLVMFPGWFSRPRPRSWLRNAPLLLLLLVCSCGGGSSPSGPQTNPNGTPAGTYDLTVTATLGSLNQPVPLKLTVQ